MTDESVKHFGDGYKPMTGMGGGVVVELLLVVISVGCGVVVPVAVMVVPVLPVVVGEAVVLAAVG